MEGKKIFWIILTVLILGPLVFVGTCIPAGFLSYMNGFDETGIILAFVIGIVAAAGVIFIVVRSIVRSGPQENTEDGKVKVNGWITVIKILSGIPIFIVILIGMLFSGESLRVNEEMLILYSIGVALALSIFAVVMMFVHKPSEETHHVGQHQQTVAN